MGSRDELVAGLEHRGTERTAGRLDLKHAAVLHHHLRHILHEQGSAGPGGGMDSVPRKAAALPDHRAAWRRQDRADLRRQDDEAPTSVLVMGDLILGAGTEDRDAMGLR